MSFSIQGRKVGLCQPPYIIAELSANHNGSLERALQTIDGMMEVGASQDALSALVNLGYARAEAHGAIVRAQRSSAAADVSSLIAAALREMGT